MKSVNQHNVDISRRDFIKKSAAVSLAAMTVSKRGVFAAGSDKLRVGMVGCGGRGTEAAMDCVRAAKGVEIVAMGDLFEDRLNQSLADLSREIDDSNHLQPRAPDGAGGRGGDAPQAGDPDLGETE